MITWTEAAEAAWKQHVAQIAPELISRGLSPDKVAARLRERIDYELRVRGISVAGQCEIEEAIARSGVGVIEEFQREETDRLAPLGWAGAFFGAIFGVLIPLVALGVELFEGMSAEIFDPIPTMLHVAAIAFVALSNGWTLYCLTRKPADRQQDIQLAAAGNAVAIGIAAYYALWYLPITHVAVVAIIFMGLGLLPLAPLLSLVTGLLLRRRLDRRIGPPMSRKIWLGAAAGFGLLVAMDVPAVFTQWAALKVANGTSVQQQAMLPWLRRFGNEEHLLRQCHWSRQRDEFRRTVTRLLAGELPMASAQEVYYRVTGQSHTQAERPKGWRTPRGFRSDEWIWDEALGGTEVGRKFPELRLKESRIDGSFDGDGAAGYVEWTMVLHNESEFQQREARALVQLPPGAVVSRLTLWINGEEREAAFGGRGEVRQAYQAVVQRRRDPVLVSSRGADRVLLQCFPVEPKGGEMKVRLGISLPLVLDGWNEAKAPLPRIIEQNFCERENLRHAVWLEAKQPLTTAAAGAREERAASGRPAQAFSLTTAQLATGALNITVRRDASLREMIAVGKRENPKAVRQELFLDAPGRELRIVLDGSRGMDEAAVALAGALRRLPERTPAKLFVSGDSLKECPYATSALVANWVERQEFVGGQDATEALLRAMESTADLAAEVIWIHGQQPLPCGKAPELEQKLVRAGGRMRILALAARSEANELVELIHAAGALEGQPRLGSLEDDISRVIRRQIEGGIRSKRTQVPAGNIPTEAVQVTDQVVRLWALEEVSRLRAGRTSQREAAVRLAIEQQLVTPVSSAVVLETQAQFDVAGLTPVNPDTVPSVPDVTQTLWLVGIAIAGLFGFARYSKCRAIER